MPRPTATPRPAPKHLLEPTPAPRRSRRLPAAAALTAVVVTGGVVGAGSLSAASAPATDAAALASQDVSAGVGSLSAEEIAEREERVSRSTARTALSAGAKTDQLASEAGPAETQRQDLSDADPKTLARALMPEYGLSAGEFSCLDSLWTKESGWSTTADNPSSSAYGIPQALPGSKMSSAGPDWQSSAETQVRWGLGYIRDRYGSACGAWGHSQSNNWY